ncbi:DUF6630 family protein [Xylocopilactobacillus apicola]|uniref:DUF6630 domain-containing protein n=1 Tax=Xylocopilactobacillus apicola TaxID=2932184 RepID=A0AAU9DMM3_9LACO|nr:hypothetical protein [Xylocopilactobacillus apicola]BDR58227.1 hypothetical protein XA3_06680 [Xylocopilactobacillus apicola]
MLRNKSELIELSKLLTENNQDAVDAVSLLVEKEEFESLDSTVAYFLCGIDENNNYDSKFDFGAYLDWKDGGEEMVESLEQGILNKKYSLDLTEIEFSDEEPETGLKEISEFLEPTAYRLINWDIDGDCYNLFVIPKDKWAQIEEMKLKIERIK